MNAFQTDHINQIDILKGFAILSVIIIHSQFDLITSFSVFYIWQAVPIFFILMGLNSGMSFKRKNIREFQDVLNEKYFFNRGKRIIIPYIFFIFFTLGIWILKTEIPFLLDPQSNFFIVTIAHYFVLIVIQFIFLFPFLYILYIKNKRFFLILCFCVNFIFEITAPINPLFNAYPFFYSPCILRYLFAIALGLWISESFVLVSKHNIIILFCSVFSVVYLFIANIYLLLSMNISVFLRPSWLQNSITYFYPALLILLGIQFLPSNSTNRIIQSISTIGKESYHIFLMQLLFFAFINYNQIFNSLPISILFDIVICIVLGKLFFIFDINVLQKYSPLLENKLKGNDSIK